MTVIAHSMIVCGRQFSFPIDFSHETAVRLPGDKKWTEIYAVNQGQILLYIHEIAHLFIDEAYSWHCKKINELRSDPLL